MRKKRIIAQWTLLVLIITAAFILGYEICGINAYGYAYHLAKGINAF